MNSVEPSFRFRNGKTWLQVKQSALRLSVAFVIFAIAICSVFKIVEYFVARPILATVDLDWIDAGWVAVNELLPIQMLIATPLMRGAFGTAVLAMLMAALLYHVNLVDALKEEVIRLQPEGKRLDAVQQAIMPFGGSSGRSLPVHKNIKQEFQEHVSPVLQMSRQKRGIEMPALIKLIANAPTFVVLYLLFMVPTYLLPYIGSNSAALNATTGLAGIGFSPAFWLHLILLLVLCVLAWARGLTLQRPGW